MLHMQHAQLALLVMERSRPEPTKVPFPAEEEAERRLRLAILRDLIAHREPRPVEAQGA